MKKTLIFLLSISLFSCSKSDSDNNNSTSGATLYFKASLNNVLLNYVVADSPSTTHGESYFHGSQNGPGEFDKSFYYGCDLLPVTATDYYPSIGLTFSNMYNTSSEISESDAFYDLFTPAPTNFLTYAQLKNWEKGMDITYRTPEGKVYSSLYGDQTGSSMTIKSSESGEDDYYFYTLKYMTFTGTVNCKLYNEEDVSDVIILKDGIYKLRFMQSNSAI